MSAQDNAGKPDKMPTSYAYQSDAGSMKTPHERTDRRRWINGLVCFTGGIVAYAVVWHPLAPAGSLISSTVEALVTATLCAIVGYDGLRVFEKRTPRGGKQDEQSE